MPTYQIRVHRVVTQETVVTLTAHSAEIAERRALSRIESPKYKGKWSEIDIEDTDVASVVDLEAEARARAEEDGCWWWLWWPSRWPPCRPRR